MSFWCWLLGHSITVRRNVEYCKRCGYPCESLYLVHYIISRKKHCDWVNANFYERWRSADPPMTKEEYKEFLE